MNGHPGKTLGVAVWDYNSDGAPDLVVANDTQRDLLFENSGDGTFTERGVLSGIAYDSNGRARGGMGIDTGVVDSTGQPTLFIGNFSSEMIGVYRHAQGGLFTDRAAASKVGSPSLGSLTFGLFLFDVDLDGDLDLFAANGHIDENIGLVEEGVAFRQRAQLFVNDGGGRFASWTPPEGDAMRQALVARGAAYADYDRDGDLDMAVVENNGPVHLWRNELGAGRGLRVRLRGRSNHSALGARVELHTTEQSQARWIRSGSSYLSQSEPVATFGLGPHEAADALVIFWPDGTSNRFDNVAGGQEVVVTQGEPSYQAVPFSDAPNRQDS